MRSRTQDYVVEYLSAVEKLNLLCSYSVITTAQNHSSLTVNYTTQKYPQQSSYRPLPNSIVMSRELYDQMCLYNGVQNESMPRKKVKQ